MLIGWGFLSGTFWLLFEIRATMVSVCFIMKKKKGANRIEDGEVFQEIETESGIV